MYMPLGDFYYANLIGVAGIVPPACSFEDQFNYVGPANPTKWIVVQGNPTADGTQLTLHKATGYPYDEDVMWARDPISGTEIKFDCDKVILESRTRFRVDSAQGHIQAVDMSTLGRFIINSNYGSGIRFHTSDGTLWSCTYWAWPDDDYHDFRVEWDRLLRVYKCFMDDVLVATHSHVLGDKVPDSTFNPQLQLLGNYMGIEKDMYFDWIKVCPVEYLFEDQFNYVGIPDPSKWIINSGSPTVDGTQLILYKPPTSASVIAGDASTGIQKLFDYDKYNTEFRARFRVGAAEGRVYLPDYVTGQYIQMKSNYGSGIACQSSDGSGYTRTVIPWPDDNYHDFIIEWNRITRVIKFYMDDVLKATHSNPSESVPDSTFNPVLYVGAPYMGSPEDQYVDWIIVKEVL